MTTRCTGLGRSQPSCARPRRRKSDSAAGHGRSTDSAEPPSSHLRLLLLAGPSSSSAVGGAPAAALGAARRAAFSPPAAACFGEGVGAESARVVVVAGPVGVRQPLFRVVVVAIKTSSNGSPNGRASFSDRRFGEYSGTVSWPRTRTARTLEGWSRRPAPHFPGGGRGGGSVVSREPKGRGRQAAVDIPQPPRCAITVRRASLAAQGSCAGLPRGQ